MGESTETAPGRSAPPVGENGTVSAAAATWNNSLQPNDKAAAPVTLASHGASDYTIIVPAKASTQDAKAASLLQHWVQQISDVQLPILADSTAERPHEISVGRTNRLDNSDLVLETQGLGEDGYEIAVDRSRVFLLGGTRRGPINAVLALLEEDLGCRWYTPSAHRAEKQSVLEVGIVPRRYLPALSLRDPFVFDAFDGKWSLMNRTNSHSASVPEELGGHLSYPPSWFVHTAGKMLSLDLFEEHPEYFAEIDGKRMREREGRHPAQLCLTNTNVQRLASEKVVRILDENPTARLISVSPNDGGDYCTCSVCTAFNKAEKSDGATLLQFVNLVADAIAAKHPDVRVVHLAYLGTDTATKTIRPRDNVVVMFATDYDAWRWPFVPYTTTEVTHRRLAPWLELGAHVYVWDYVTNFSHYLLPMPNISVIERNMHFLLEQGVEGLFLQGAYQSPGSARGPMRAWVWAKKLWDPSRRADELVRDFTYGYFEAAAPPMQEYNELLEQVHQDHLDRFVAEYESGHEVLYNIRYDPGVLFLEADFLNAASRLFAEAEQLASSSEILARVRLAKLSILYAKLSGDPGYTDDDYGELIEEFESIARTEKVTHLREGAPDADEKLSGWRANYAEYRAKN